MSTDQFHRQMGQSVGAKLRAARQAKRYTQSKLAWPDFSVSYISAIERGQIHPSLRALRFWPVVSIYLRPTSYPKNRKIRQPVTVTLLSIHPPVKKKLLP